MREALCQYIVRAPVSLQLIRWDEQQDAVTESSAPSGYFKGRQRRYSLRGRGSWKDRSALRSRAPAWITTVGERLHWVDRADNDDSHMAAESAGADPRGAEHA